MNGDLAELESGAEYYEQTHDRVIVPRVALATEVYFTEKSTGARFRYDRDRVEDELDDGTIRRVDETAEVLA
jgi:hypothetical protein